MLTGYEVVFLLGVNRGESPSESVTLDQTFFKRCVGNGLKPVRYDASEESDDNLEAFPGRSVMTPAGRTIADARLAGKT